MTLHENMSDRLFGVVGTWRITRCNDPACATLWLDPAPVEEDLELAYRDYYTHAGPGRVPPRTLEGPWRWVKQGYLAERFGYRFPAGSPQRILAGLLVPFPARRENLDALVMYLPARPGGRMLDVGCGDGRTLHALSRLGWQVEGIDLDPQAVAAVTQRGFRAHVGTLEARRFPDGEFDAITASHVLEHVKQPETFLRECRRVLRPGGMLTVLTPNAGGLGCRRFDRAWRGLEPPRHLQILTAPALERLAHRAGFDDRRVWSSARMAAFICRESRALQSGIRGRRTGQLEATWFQFEERRALRADPWAGEELVMVARRT
jgi:2-polyprenyl-3-methyl-5-hydroxy-6-metoxy-1,4-benzoquinol methylase